MMKHKKILPFLYAFVLLIVTSFFTLSFSHCKKDNVKELSDKKEILGFVLPEQTDSAIIDSASHRIVVVVNNGTNLKALVPTIQISAAASIAPASGTKVDFSSFNVIFTVTAEDKTTQQWTVELSIAGIPDNKIVTIEVANSEKIKFTDSLVTIYFLGKQDLTSIKPVFTLSDGATISPASDTETDFTQGPVSYTVTASDGKRRVYLLKIIEVLYKEKNIVSVTFPNTSGGEAIGNEYLVYLSPGTMVEKAMPEFTLSPGASIVPASGTEIDFRAGYAEFTVTAENGAKAKWKVYVTYPLIEADNSKFQYIGRFDLSTPKKPKFAAPGAYITAKFKGTTCDVVLRDEYRYGQYLNYFAVSIDNMPAVRYKMENGKKLYRLATNLSNSEHLITITKDSEAGIGYLEFGGFRCSELVEAPALPTRKIECFGNSITCGAGIGTDLCDSAQGSLWYISNKASKSYGALLAHALNAQYHLTSVSGIGLVHSCCDMTYVMPDIFNKIYLDNVSSVNWDFSSYIPDVVTIALGQNDGVMDSAVFCSAYVKFIKSLRVYYPAASVFCITSPMSDDNLLAFQKKCLTGITEKMNADGDNKVYKVYLTNKLNNGCTTHPDGSQHIIIADELKAAITEKMGW